MKAMQQNLLKHVLRRGDVACGIFVTEFLSPGLCRIVANANLDFIVLDMEHGGIGIDEVKQQIAFARGTGVTAIVRVPILQRHLVATVLDAGAMGIIAPMIESRAQAEQLAAWCRYRPDGVRGIGFGVAHDGYGLGEIAPRTKVANENLLAIPLIESLAGIAAVDSILSVDGIDMAWMGHFDLTDSMSITGQFDHPDFVAALDRFLAACNRYEKPAGIIATSLEGARQRLQQGFRCLSYGSDVSVFQEALSDAIECVRKGAV